MKKTQLTRLKKIMAVLADVILALSIILLVLDKCINKIQVNSDLEWFLSVILSVIIIAIELVEFEIDKL